MPYFRFGAGGNEALSNRCEENDFFHIFWYFSHLQVLLFQGHRPIIFFFSFWTKLYLFFLVKKIRRIKPDIRARDAFLIRKSQLKTHFL